MTTPHTQPPNGQADISPEPNDLQAMEQERNEYLNGWKRALADFENFKREVSDRIQKAALDERKRIIREMLPVIDTLEKALNHVPPEQQTSPWYQGLVHVRSQWDSFLSANDISKIASEGAQFDPEMHEAIHTEHHPDKENNAILSVVEHGYLLDNELIRPARVTVNITS